MKNTTTEEVMDKLDIFWAIFGKVNQFCGWDMEIIQIDARTQFTSKEFQEGLFVHGVLLKLVAPDHQEMNDQAEVTCRTLQNITYSIMVHTWVSENIYTFCINIKD